eukprot:CAMPEP_0183747604 /NCGR_PEP_ID=MMETSP0737-20130205/67347_1 /TAXON_ID=385413 /ORGANISM="Thalassiosira miniscula, Strain CCMP1093" /LENGTH=2129 /DNA_ID=CAMNT_0025983317 /DNA_START=37 /DNA_END=6424 /DNA_ORIENTATION=+
MESDGKPPPTKAAPRPPSPNLDECIKSIITLGKNAAALSTKNQATLITAMVGYCIHLSKDQDALATFMRGSSNKEISGSPLPLSGMPAIRELVTDPSLFQCVISMLSHSPNVVGGTKPLVGATQNAHLPGNSYQQKHGGRKRSPSEDVSAGLPSMARKKQMLSPTPKNRLHPNKPGGGDGSKVQQKISSKHIPVFAATILYSVFQHAEHWPVQIMKAFAEDSFGPRLWVDDERCKAFVSNLEISLKMQEMDDKIDQKSTASVAESVETYFASLLARASLANKPAGTPAANNKVFNGAGPTPSSSSSQQQAKVLSTKEKRKQTKKSSADTSSSSSSGEEEVLESETVSSSAISAPPQRSPSTGGAAAASASTLRLLFYTDSIIPNKKPTVRPRYHMQSRVLAFKVVSDAFQDRLNSKSKQNYRLLQILPTFLSIPRVRCVASQHLERWLQSPALAGPARNIFARVVQELRCVEPPLQADLELIGNILKLNLKANQLSMHVEHITMIAKRMPTLNVAQLIFTHCLKGECSSGSVSNALKPTDDHLRILRSAYAVLDRKLAANALASSVSSLAADAFDSASNTSDINSQLQNISWLLCAVVDALGKLYDGFHFVKAMIKYQSSGTSKTMISVDTTARLIFECTLLVTRTIPSLQTAFDTNASRNGNKKSPIYDYDAVDEEELARFRTSMLGLRKTILSWCATDFCRVYYAKVKQEEKAKRAETNYEQGAVKRGPGAPDWSSALGADSFSEVNDRSPFHRMMTSIRCILFLSPKDLETFSITASEEIERDGINVSVSVVNMVLMYGVDVDDEMMQIILSSSNVTPNTALSVIENLLLRCGSSSPATVNCNMDTVWNMYKLAEYKPVFRSDYSNGSNSFSSNDNDSMIVCDDSKSDTEKRVRKEKLQGGSEDLSAPDKSKLPRLAVTSMWWRVSSIVLVLSGLLPHEIGSTIWDEHPTLAALIRMTTSQKYRFPTADCSETEKERVRRAEETVKEEEAKIAEMLFMPAKKQNIIKPEPTILSPSKHRRGLRSSARQREKQEKIMAIEQERQAAALHAENMKLRKVLRTLQKNVMIWNPGQYQRKPPKGSIELLLSVNESFNLAEKFRLSTSPDFLLQTIGEGRSAIERAYDWLIPIISTHPTIIDRLQPSATCFLLLRAYGAEGDKNRELLDLTAPLLSHVTKCLTGEFGEHHALLAMELLLQDIADENDDRRRCARKVLQEAVGDANVSDAPQILRELGHCGWLVQMTNVKHCKKLAPLAIKYLTQALAYERGKVLSMYISALSEYKIFLQKHEIAQDFDFVSTLCEIITVRSRVCSDAFDRFPPLRALAIGEVKDAFEKAIDSNGNHSLKGSSASHLVSILIPGEDGGSDQKGKVSNVVVSSNLLHAAIILISNWERRDDGDCGLHNDDEDTSISNLLRYLVIPFVQDGSDEGDGNTVSGLSSAKLKHNGKRVVSVEEWVLLAKARAEKVAKHAALSAPNIFLPRLLLCCGMPSTSFYTMLSRLDRMGESSTDSGKTYEEIISPAAVSEWGLPGIGSRRIIKRKLYGRILAYLRVHGNHKPERRTHTLNTSKSSFLSWLSAENNCPEKTKRTNPDIQATTSVFNNAISCMTDSDDFDDMMDKQEGGKGLAEIWLRADSKNVTTDKSHAVEETLSGDFVTSCVENDHCNLLEEALDLIVTKSLYSKEVKGIAAAKTILGLYNSCRRNQGFVRILVKWVPVLTQERGDNDLWKLIFIEQDEEVVDWFHLKSLVCECVMKWSDEHIAACQEWIVSQQTKSNPWTNVSSLGLVLRFLVVSSEQMSIHCFDFDDNAHLQFHCAQTEECAVSLIKLSLYYVDLDGSGVNTNGSKREDESRVLLKRNSLPDWLTLVLLIAKSHQGLVTRLILEKMEGKKHALLLYSVLLRLYLMSPLKMNLSDSKLRNALLEASNDNSPSWLYWRCPLDSQLSEMLSNLTKSPHQRLVQSATDIAKQHPLIFVRHLSTICQKLVKDGSGRDSDKHRLMKRGRIFGKHPSGDAVAKIGNHTVKVTIVLWGYSFNEPVWTSVLDVLVALPLEVIFKCGAGIGLTEILEIYLKLFGVQTLDLNSESNIVRIREKFMNLTDLIRKCNAEYFEDWMQRRVSDWSNVANVRQMLS